MMRTHYILDILEIILKPLALIAKPAGNGQDAANVG